MLRNCSYFIQLLFNSISLSENCSYLTALNITTNRDQIQIIEPANPTQASIGTVKRTNFPFNRKKPPVKPQE